MTSPGYDLDDVRSRIPLLETHIPLNNCSQAPQCAATRAAAEAYLASWNEAGMDWEAWIGETEAARAEFARLIGADPEDVAVATSLSQATASVATGLDFRHGRPGVVVSGAEFPTVAHVWLAQERFGAQVRRVPVRDGAIDPASYADAVDETTAVVSACTAYYQTGATQDIAVIAEIAHERGALLYVDAYQTLGAGPLDAPASGADFLASGNLKFLMGIPGIAFLWVRPGLAERLEPAITGWFGRRAPFDFAADRLDWADGARRLDTGTPPILEAYVVRAGMAWLREIGLDAIGAWTAHLSRLCAEEARARGLTVLGPSDPARRGPTTAVACARSHEVEAALRAQGVLVSARGPAVRLAPHFYSTEADVLEALDRLAAVVGRAE